MLRARKLRRSYSSKRILWICITCDVDQDYFDPSLIHEAKTPHMNWQGVEMGISAIIESTQNIYDSSGYHLCFTWFLRVDNQLQDVYGDAGFLLDQYSPIWKECKSRGDEIGWHPHLYRQEGNDWRQETDNNRLLLLMNASYRAILKKNYKVISSRIGEAFCSNVIMAKLASLGIRCDATAMPGRKRNDEWRNLDWEGTPTVPYRPSEKDYRRPGMPDLCLLEVPMSMVWVKAEYDHQSIMRYVDLAFYHEALRDGLRDYLQKAVLLVTTTHPSTVIPEIARQRHGLLSFDIREFKKNLEFIISECDQLNRPYRFIRIKDCWDLFLQEAQVMRKPALPITEITEKKKDVP